MNEVKMSGSFAIALMTGRPELARIGMKDLSPTEVADYAEFLVRETLAERERITLVRARLAEVMENLDGVTSALASLDEGLLIAESGGSPDLVRRAIRGEE